MWRIWTVGKMNTSETLVEIMDRNYKLPPFDMVSEFCQNF